MAIEISPLVQPWVGQSSRQLPLPLPLSLGPPVTPSSVLRPMMETMETVEVVPQHVWPHLAAPAQAQVRQTFVRILQEVLHDGDSGAAGAPPGAPR
jgi:hypothetical protein